MRYKKDKFSTMSYYHFHGEYVTRQIDISNNDVIKLSEDNPTYNKCKYTLCVEPFSSFEWHPDDFIDQISFEDLWNNRVEVNPLSNKFTLDAIMLEKHILISYCHWKGEYPERQIIIYKGFVMKFTFDRPIYGEFAMYDQPYTMFEWKQENLISEREFEEAWNNLKEVNALGNSQE